MQDRRREPRTACRIGCRVHYRKETVPARIVDVSESGLGLVSKTWFTTRSQIEITLDLPNREHAQVRGQVWHARRATVKRTGTKIWVVGIILEESDDSYRDLLAEASVLADANATTRVGSDAATPAGTDAAARSGSARDASGARPGVTGRGAASADPALDDAGLPAFRIRVKARSGPRTRMLTLNASSVDEARALADRDLAREWSVLEVKAL